MRLALCFLVALAACPAAEPADDDDTTEAPVCGDGVVGGAEFCDDGNADDLDDCARDCTPAPPFHDFDQVFLDLMADWDLPGGAVAVVKDGRLVLRRGYGLADVEAEEATRWTDRFRVASVSKPVTSAAVMSLVEEGLLDLDEPAFALLDDLQGADPTAEAPRLTQITIRDLLQHSGGWDRDASFDPMFFSTQIAAAMGVEAPAEAEAVVRYMRNVPLDFDPGTAYAYSNFGYCVLGRIIERVTGLSYGDAVRQRILDPAGIESMALGRSRLQDRLAGEVRYYGAPGQGLTQSVFPGEGMVPLEYGSFYIEAMDSHGAWVASAPDLARFVEAVDGRPNVADVLTPSAIESMTAQPQVPTWAGSPYWYAFGWLVRPSNGDANWWHGGSLPGTTAMVLRSWDGFTMVALFNARDPQAQVGGAVDAALWQARDTVTAWPDYDLFEN